MTWFWFGPQVVVELISRVLLSGDNLTRQIKKKKKERKLE